NAASVVVFAGSIVFIVAFALSNTVAPKIALAGTNYYTRQNGEWQQTSLWSTSSATGASCACNIGCNPNYDIYVNNQVVDSFCTPLKFSGGAKVSILNGGNLTALHGLEVSSSQITISNGDSLIVYGDVLLSGGSKIKVNGYLKINGDLTLTGGSTID